MGGAIAAAMVTPVQELQGFHEEYLELFPDERPTASVLDEVDEEEAM